MTANVRGRDLGSFVKEVQDRVATVVIGDVIKLMHLIASYLQIFHRIDSR